MDKTLFDRLVKETYATYGKPDPRPAVLDAAYKHVADMPDDFIVWASERLQDADRLPPNLGRELRKELYPAWKASQMPTFTNEQFYADMCGDPDCPECHGKGWFYVWKRGAKSAKTLMNSAPMILRVRSGSETPASRSRKRSVAST